CPNPTFPSVPPSLPLRRRRLPLPASNHPAKERPPLLAAAPCERPVAGPLCGRRAASGFARGRLPPLRAGRNRPCPRAGAAPADGASTRRHRPCELLPLRVGVAPCECRWPPFQASPGRSQTPPCRGLGHGLAMGGRPCMGAGRPSSSLPMLPKCSMNM
ncbi:hypothetical protein BHM03_00052500, partial [Ensete ventricosum]